MMQTKTAWFAWPPEACDFFAKLIPHVSMMVFLLVSPAIKHKTLCKLS
jgi:predicted small integral membrane protein